ncbi:MAG: hypothetical protein Q7K98_05385 [Candidatus Omnitrophota bacterium]|nr:hypothetical protein [Candidatus Omnitrophota bacterium]
MAEEKLKKSDKISDDLKELVIYRLDTFPEDKRISIGSDGEFSKSELIEHVRNGDEIGQKIVELELTFLRALKEGVLLNEINQ